MQMKKINVVSKLVKVQVRSNITGRILGEKSISESASQFGRDAVVSRILEPLIQDSRDVYITVMDSENSIVDEYKM